MHKRFARVRVPPVALLVLFVLGTFATWLGAFTEPVKAANFSMQTGYYVGSATARTISGIGFAPNLVILKPATSVSAAFYKTSAMPSDTTGYLSASSMATGSIIVLTSDGFTVAAGNSVNNSGVLYSWTAFGGSDCTATGTFCVGTYTGDATTNRTVTTGFQPSLVINKSSASVGAHFRTATMPSLRSEYINTGAAANTLITALNPTTFTVGTTDNSSGATFYFAAFKATSGVMAEGSYTGDGTDNRSITSPGFKPSTVFVKNSTSATSANRRAVMKNNLQPTNAASVTGDAVADVPDSIQDLETNGFQLGTNATVNENTIIFYWFAFGSAVTPPGSGTFKMASGSYVGSGVARSITGLGFKPDLVLIKETGTSYAVFSLSNMPANSTAYLSNGSVNVSGFITALDTDGFSLGTSTVVNGGSRTYYYQAFGNAYKSDTKSGAADFAIGAYNPTVTDDTFVPGAPYQLDFMTIKQNGSQVAAYRTSDMAGDLSNTLNTAVEAPNIIQSLGVGGFQVGTASTVNVAGGLYYWFGFKAGSNFVVGSYTGDGVDGKAVTLGSGIQADHIWLKSSAGGQPYSRPYVLGGDASMPMANAVNAAGRIKSITSTGMTVGNNFEVNSNGVVYRYMAWKIPSSGVLSSDIVDSGGVTVASPSFAMNSSGFPYDCSVSTGILGTSAQRIRISNLTTSPGWTMSIAATDGATALWRNTGNTQQFDYNDSGGCSDGGDTDSFAGKLRIAPSGATLTPQSGCSTSNVTLGSDQDFNETSLNSITLMSASTGASTNCYWDLTNIQLQQTIPVNQASDSYNINLTLTTIAS